MERQTVLAFVNLQLGGNMHIDLKFENSTVYWRARKIAKSDYKLCRVCVCPSVCPHGTTRPPTGRVFI